MANLWAMYSVGNSLVSYLRNEYDQLRMDYDDGLLPQLGEDPDALPNCQFCLIGGNEFDDIDDSAATLSLFLYRVIMNEHLRSATRSNGNFANSVPLSLDLHYLMTAWAPNALTEHFIFAWAVRQMHLHPVFDSSVLAGAGWQDNEVVHIVPAELTNEDLMRIWDALQPTYHLSKAYIARAIRINPDHPAIDGPPVVATRFLVGDRSLIQESNR